VPTTQETTLLRAALPVKCPACGAEVPWPRASVDTAFLCPSCGRSIQVRRSYFRSLGLLSIPLAGFLAYALGARRDVLFWSTLLGAFPLQFIMGFITLRLFRPDAELTGDYRSILHPVDPEALDRPAPATDGRNESDA
jgi:predicted RNA-binding Zn-ribbon protein involved in translation (DUF1610 family)